MSTKIHLYFKSYPDLELIEQNVVLTGLPKLGFGDASRTYRVYLNKFFVKNYKNQLIKTGNFGLMQEIVDDSIKILLTILRLLHTFSSEIVTCHHYST